MKVKINTYEFRRIEVEGKEFDMPDETSYYFQTGKRRSIRFIPIWSSWKHEKGENEIILQYHITVVYLSSKNKVESFKVSATSGLSDLYNLKEDRFNSEQASIIKALFDCELDERTKEEFEADLNAAIYNFDNF